MIVKEIPWLDEFMKKLDSSLELNRWFLAKEFVKMLDDMINMEISENEMIRQMFKYCAHNKTWEIRPIFVGKSNNNKITFMFGKVKL